MQIKNEYHLELIEEKTGRVKQVVDCSNVVVNAVYTRVLAGDYAMLRGIAVGTGSGTPSAADTGLFSYLYGADGIVTNERTFPTYKKTIKITIGAAVGNGVLTECAVGAISYSAMPTNGIATHALFTDAEGNPITINKTSLDILQITATIYFTLNVVGSAEEGVTSFLCKNSNNLIYNLVANENTLNNVYSYPIIKDFNSYEDALIKIGGSMIASSITVNNGVVTIPARSILYTDDNQWNNTKGYEVFGLFLDGVGAFKITPEIFPPTPFGKYQIGVGDGTNKGFYTKTPSFKEGTQKVYINSVLQTEGVDYIAHSQLLGDFYYNYISTLEEYFLHMPLATLSGSYGYPTYPYSRPSGKCVAMYNEAGYQPVWDFKVPVPINCLVHPSAANSLTNCAVLQSSQDNATWENVINLDSTTYDKGMVSFQEVTARYWRIGALANMPSGWIYFTPGQGSKQPPFCFGYSVPNVQFTTAPPLGAVVEIEYDLERPFKNNRHNITFSGSFEYGR